jgi:hypothetical protein
VVRPHHTLDKATGAALLAVFAATILLLNGKFLIGFVGSFDILLYDETNSLLSGKELGLHPPATTDGFLYGLYYWCVLRFFEPVEAYYANYVILSVAGSCLVFAVMLRLSDRPTAALIATFLFIISFMNAKMWPKISNFALLLMLVAMLLSMQVRTRTAKLLVGAVFSLVLSFARSEFLLLYAILQVLVIGVAIRDRARTGLLLCGALVAAALMLAASGLLFALSEAGHDRAYHALASHYAVNWVHWTGSNLDPWQNWTAIWQRDFGASQNLFGALVANPRQMLHHILTNVLNLAVEIGRAFAHYPLVPIAGSKIVIAAEAMALAALAAVSIFLSRRKLLQVLGPWRIEALIFAAFAIPGLGSSVVLYPRMHYLVPVYLGLIIITALAIQLQFLERFEIAGRSMTQAIAAAVVLLLLMPAPFARPATDDDVKFAVSRPIRDRIKILDGLAAAKPITILSDDPGYDVYLPPGRVKRLVPILEETETGFYRVSTFGELIGSVSPDAVILPMDGTRRGDLEDDRSVAEFQGAPCSFGYQQYPAQGGHVLYVKVSDRAGAPEAAGNSRPADGHPAACAATPAPGGKR